MKTTAFTFIAISVLFCACSSPDKEGKELGSKYCDCIGNFRTFTKFSQFKQKKDSCDRILKNDWTSYESKYMKDAVKWNAFLSAFQNTSQKTIADFNALFSTTIINSLGDKTWVKEGEQNTLYYLLRFENNSVQALNCKGEIPYKVMDDTLKFPDKTNSNILIEITSDSTMILSDLFHKSIMHYHTAELKDEIIGRWDGSNSVSIGFYSNESCAVSNGYSVENSSFTIKNGILSINGAGAYKITLSNFNSFSWGQAYFTRLRLKLPENVEFLVKNEK